MNMIAWVLLLCSWAHAAEDCLTADVVEVRLPVAPSSGFVWVYDASASDVKCESGALGVYEASEERSEQVFQLQCPHDPAKVRFSLRTLWAREAVQSYEVEITGRVGTKGA